MGPESQVFRFSPVWMYLHNHTDIKVWDPLKIVISIGIRLELHLVVVTMLMDRNQRRQGLA